MSETECEGKDGAAKNFEMGGDDASQRQDAWYPKQMIQQLECKPFASSGREVHLAGGFLGGCQCVTVLQGL